MSIARFGTSTSGSISALKAKITSREVKINKMMKQLNSTKPPAFAKKIMRTNVTKLRQQITKLKKVLSVKLKKKTTSPKNKLSPKNQNKLLHDSIALLTTDPVKALTQVKKILRAGHFNINAPAHRFSAGQLVGSSASWGKPCPLLTHRVNILTQVIGNKFRSDFVHSYYDERKDDFGGPIVQIQNASQDLDQPEVGKPVSVRSLIDTMRFRIIKELLAYGAEVDQDTVNLAVSMNDSFTVVELFRHTGGDWQPEYSRLMMPVLRSRFDYPYTYQEVGDQVKWKGTRGKTNVRKGVQDRSMIRDFMKDELRYQVY